MPNGWSFNWENTAMKAKQEPKDALYGKLAYCLCTECPFYL